MNMSANRSSAHENTAPRKYGTIGPQRILNILGFVLEDIESYGQTQAVISCDSNQATYRFESGDGRPAMGAIEAPAHKALMDFLDFGSHALGFTVDLPGDAGKRLLKIESISPVPEYRVFWHGTAESSSARLSIVHQEPQKKDPSEKPGKKTGSAKPASHTGSVLVIEDNSAFAHVLSRFLKRHDISCTFTATANEALELLARNSSRFLLVVCDVHMPGLNGIEFLEKLRADSQLHNIPVLMLTSDESVETRIRAISSGAEVFLTKTEDPRILCAHVTRILAKAKRADTA